MFDIFEYSFFSCKKILDFEIWNMGFPGELYEIVGDSEELKKEVSNR